MLNIIAMFITGAIALYLGITLIIQTAIFLDTRHKGKRKEK